MAAELEGASPPALPAGGRAVAVVEPVSGARKAAVLMAALGSERAASVLSHLKQEEIENVSLELARLSSVGAEATESVFNEVVAATSKGGQGAEGGVDFAREVIERALGPERAVELLGRISGSEEARPFEFLRGLAPERIAALLKPESPQTLALVLANLNTGLAAGVLARLPDVDQPEIALRIARMGKPQGAVIARVEEALRQRMSAVAEREYSSAGGSKALAGILNHSDRSVERNVLENLAKSDKPLADEVRGMLFVFEDIIKLEERAIQQLLREVDQKDLVLALRGAPDEVRDVVLANMSERGAEMLKEEMEIQPPQRKRDVDAAQSRIVGVVRRLEEAGTIVIGGGGEDGEDESESVV